MTRLKSSLIAYVCFVIIVACGVFLNGFFPFRSPSNVYSSKKDLPSSVGDNRLSVEQLYRRRYSKMILMVIDALRFDFVADEQRMPFLNELLQNKMSSCLLVTRTEVPTVTLPRIKAIVSGTVPGFLDVVFNFGSSEMTEDNIITQAFQQGYEITFYGDDTWLRLYPSIFERSEGTSSFFVNDFYEVDFNVTRNLRNELNRSDWDLMILHYLGLDHIGHVEGPFGKSISSKLKEMDDVIREIVQYLENLKIGSNSEGLLILTGDHGMKDSGGHGGSSYEEVTVPVVLLNSRCQSEPQSESILQVDLAPLLAAFMGVPTPASSTGRIDSQLLSGLHPNESLYISYYNALRMKNNFKHSVNEEVQDEFKRGVFHYDSWMKNNYESDWKRASEYFFAVQEKIASLVAKSNEISILSLVSAITLLFQGLTLLFCEPSHSFWYSTKVFLLPLLLILCLLVGIDSTFATPLSSILAIGLLLNNAVLMLSSTFSSKAVKGVDYFFVMIISLHPLSFISTSFIEEEHQFWYFTFATLLAYIMYKENHLRKALIPLLFMQRCLRTVNQTGDKWASVPDFGDWLRLPENSFYMSCFYFSGLICSAFANWKCGFEKQPSSVVDLIFILLQGLLCLLYNAAIGTVSLPFHYRKSSGILEVKLFWIITLLRTIVAVLKWWRIKGNFCHGRGPRKIMSILTQLHFSIICLLVKPHNILFAPSLFLFSLILGSSIQQWWKLEVLHYGLGMVFFFYMTEIGARFVHENSLIGGLHEHAFITCFEFISQGYYFAFEGNSNSIASVDVSVGFIGLKDFNIVQTGLYIILHTYAYPILAYLLLFGKLLNSKISKAGTYELVQDSSRTYILLNGIPLLVFMVLMVIQRHHLFIWSVFSPKLLYLSCQTVLIVCLVVPSSFSIGKSKREPKTS